MMRSLAFSVLLACAACATKEISDPPAGPFNRGPASSSGSSDDESTDVPPPVFGQCDDSPTMTDPRIVDQPFEKAGHTGVRFAWEKGTGKAAELPWSYYEKPKLEEGSIVVATSLTNEREMIVTISGAPSTHAGRIETFQLNFPDRRNFVSCGHQGMDDIYRVIVTITFSADASSATATFEEEVDLGAI